MNKNDILIIHGTDYKEMTKKILEAADLAALIGKKDARVALKPNLVTSNPPSSGATTHPELLSGAIEYLREHGFENVVIMEGAWVGCGTQSAFRAAGYDRVCSQYNVPFIDLQTFYQRMQRGEKIPPDDRFVGDLRHFPCRDALGTGHFKSFFQESFAVLTARTIVKKHMKGIKIFVLRVDTVAGESSAETVGTVVHGPHGIG